MWIIFAAILLLIAAASLYQIILYFYYQKCGVQCSFPLPVVGDLLKVSLGLEHYSDSLVRHYKKFRNERFYVSFEFFHPMVFVNDPELIKKITIRDFDYFIDHRVVVDSSVDPPWGRGLFSLKGAKWKHMRAIMSPAFTSAKMRLMFPLIVETCDRLVKHLQRRIETSVDGYVVFEAKDLLSRVAHDVIASCSFGLKVDSISEDNQFYKMGMEMAVFKLKHVLLFVAYSSFPRLMSALKLTIISDKAYKFISNLLLKSIEERKENNLYRPDMINLMLSAKKGNLAQDDMNNDTSVGFSTVQESEIGKAINKIDWSEDDLMSQAMLFIIGGLETASSVMAASMHVLARNPDVQDRLAKEIKETDIENNGKLDLKIIKSMVYMDMVVSETLRLWSPGFLIERQCVNDYNFGKVNENSKEDFILKKGETVSIPAWALHRDPEYFPDPLKFDPERFAAENLHKFSSQVYMPFGLGPRSCIGSRFALIEIKVMLYHVLLHFEVCPTTNRPLKQAKTAFGVKIDMDTVKFKLRK